MFKSILFCSDDDNKKNPKQIVVSRNIFAYSIMHMLSIYYHTSGCFRFKLIIYSVVAQN